MVAIGVVGAGYWGKNHVRVFKELESEGVISSVKICDTDAQRAKELSEIFGPEYTTDYKNLLGDRRIDAVSIVTPSPTHYEIAREFLEAGKDVLIEKPMTLDSKQAKELVKIAAKNKRILMAGHIFRYHPAVRELKQRIDRGDLGKIYFFIGSRLAFDAPRRDMGVVFALGIHEMDLFCYLLGVDYPSEITAITGEYLQPDIEETATIITGFGKGIMGYAIESWLVPAYGKKRELIVTGSEKSARIDYFKPQELEIFDTRIKTYLLDGEKHFSLENTQKTVVPLEYKEPLKEELRHFVECVKTRSRPISDGKVGMRAVEMAEVALRSAKLKKTIKL